MRSVADVGSTVDAADIAPGEADEAAGLESSIGGADLFAEIGEGHGVLIKAETFTIPIT